MAEISIEVKDLVKIYNVEDRGSFRFTRFKC